MNTQFSELNNEELQNLDGGVITLTVLGVTLTGAKAVAAIAAGVTAVGGAAGLGPGDNEERKVEG